MTLDRATLTVALAALLLACDRSPATPGLSREEERTLQRLKEEVDRDDPNAKLAKVVLAPPSETRQTLPAPRQPRAALGGGLTLEVVALTASQVVEGAKMNVATEDRFLRVQLTVKNAGKRPAAVELGRAALVGEEARTWGLARDVQRLAGTRGLQAEVPGGEDRDFVLLFEVPEDALRGGLRLKVPGAGGNEDAVISLD